MTGHRREREPNAPVRADATPALVHEARVRAEPPSVAARERDPVWLADEEDLDLL